MTVVPYADLDGLATLKPFLTSTALEIPDGAELSLEAGIGLLDKLCGLETGSSLWLGDHWLWLERNYGDEFKHRIEPADYERCRQAIWVAERCPPSIRKEALTFSHYRTVASLKEESERERWLEESVANGWTVAQLREALKGPAKERASWRQVCDFMRDNIGEVWTDEKQERLEGMR